MEIATSRLIEAAKAGDLAVVRQLVQGGVSFNAKDSDGRTALMWAACSGRVEIVQYLVEQGADKGTALMWAAEQGQLGMVQYLVERGGGGSTAMMWAAENGHLGVVRYLAEHSVHTTHHQMPILTIKSVTSGGYLDGRNPGMPDPCLASGYRNPTTVAYLQWIIGDVGNGRKFIKSVSSGQYLDGRNAGMSDPLLSSGGRNPAADAYLQWIIGDAGNGHKFIKSVSSGQYLDGRNSGMSNPLLSSGERNPAADAYLQWVIEVKDSAGWTTLIWAAHWGHLGVVRYLVEQGANQEVVDNEGNTALVRAAELNHLEVVQYLIRRAVGVEPTNHNRWTPLFWDVFRRYLVGRGSNNDVRDNEGNTALMGAARGGHGEVVRYLIRRGVDIEATNHMGWTALIWAAASGKYDVVRYLVERGANKEAMDNEGNTALMRAVHGHHLEVVRYLGGKIVNIEARNCMGWTALIGAAVVGSVYLVRYFVERGANKEARDNNGRTALSWGVQDRHLDIVRYLVERGVNKETKDRNYRTALIKAALYDHVKVVRYLIEQGANIHTALEWASQQHQLNVICHVIEQGADRGAALMWAVKTQHLEVVRFIVELDADASYLDSQGNSALVHLLNLNIGEDKILPLAKLLLEHGAPPLESVTSIAKVKGYISVAALVEEHAAKSRQEPETEDPKWFISSGAIKKLGAVLGQGSSGKVYRAKWAFIDVVVKEICVVNTQQFMQEVTTWCDLRHLYVVQFYGANYRNEPCFIVSKHASQGELVPYLTKTKGKGETAVWRKLREAAVGLWYLHQQDIVHGDLRGDNIVVSSDGTAMLTDFGLSFSEFGPSPLDNVGDKLGSMQWRAPEFVRMPEEKLTCKSDIFSLGMCIIQAVTGDIPWGKNLLPEKIREIYRSGEFRIDRPAELEADQWRLVERMIAFNPYCRPNMDEVVSTLEKFAEDEECPPFRSRPI
ncbi:Leucine-rich repeat serine/threonine-protein kinase 2 [Phytophthora pseudosyringae]|uniref:Leucine-rich repeat serine/threonine-protein kinase 2 n=1 Tax=Phytophthora pseudosyringae TaxID=221518 RepID=A0A8T1VRR4_9STRA|nr:Leucine-rich repeat serine/threonine-protein kinase 2 [Phytophthora pseudosyringae]